MTARCHICLIGEALCRNRELVDRLMSRNAVSLLHEFDSTDLEVAGLAQALAVDCGTRGVALAEEWGVARRATSGGAIVVTDGGLRSGEIARLLTAGARDYFSAPLDVAIVAERLEHLAATVGDDAEDREEVR